MKGCKALLRWLTFLSCLKQNQLSVSYKKRFSSSTIVAKLAKGLSTYHCRADEPLHLDTVLNYVQCKFGDGAWSWLWGSAAQVLLVVPTFAQCLWLVSKWFLSDFLTEQVAVKPPLFWHFHHPSLPQTGFTTKFASASQKLRVHIHFISIFMPISQPFMKFVQFWAFNTLSFPKLEDPRLLY